MLCFFHAQRTDRCFPSARFLNFRSRGGGGRDKKENIKNEEMHNVSGSGTDPHIQVCACMRSLKPEPKASPFLRLLAASEKKLLGLQWVTSPQHRSWRSCTPWEQKTCLAGYSDPKHWDELAQAQDIMQVGFPPCKPFFIPLASCLSSISTLPISSIESPILSQLLSSYTGYANGSDEQSSWLLFSPPGSGQVAQDSPLVLHSSPSQLWHSCSQHWLCWETGVLVKCTFSWKVSSFHRNFDFLMETKNVLA